MKLWFWKLGISNCKIFLKLKSESGKIASFPIEFSFYLTVSPHPITVVVILQLTIIIIQLQVQIVYMFVLWVDCVVVHDVSCASTLCMSKENSVYAASLYTSWENFWCHAPNHQFGRFKSRISVPWHGSVPMFAWHGTTQACFRANTSHNCVPMDTDDLPEARFGIISFTFFVPNKLL